MLYTATTLKYSKCRTWNHSKVWCDMYPEHMETKSLREVVGGEYEVGKVYSKATGLYKMHFKHTDQWSSLHSFWIGYDFQLVYSFNQPTKTWRDSQSTRQLDNFKINIFHLVGVLYKIVCWVNLGHGDDCWIENNLDIVRTFYCGTSFQWTNFILTLLPCHIHFYVDLVYLINSQGCQRCSEIYTGNWWWHKHNFHSTGTSIVTAISMADKTLLTNLSDDLCPWLLYLASCNIRKDNSHTPKLLAWVLSETILCPLKGAKHTFRICHNVVGIELFPLRISTLLVPAWNGTVLMDLKENVAVCG